MTPEKIEKLRQYAIDAMKSHFRDWNKFVWFSDDWHEDTERDIWLVAKCPERDMCGPEALKILEMAQILGVWLEWDVSSESLVPIPLDEWKRKVGES